MDLRTQVIQEIQPLNCPGAQQHGEGGSKVS